jgi:hypothetical protein
LQHFYYSHSKQLLTSRGLRQQSRRFHGTGRSSSEGAKGGFSPAFFDTDSGIIYPSLYADGRPAAIHVLDGLPSEVVIRRSRTGKITAVRGSIVAGFVRDDVFFTRDQAAEALADETSSVECDTALEPVLS